VLESIPEPHAVGMSESTRRNSEAVWRREKKKKKKEEEEEEEERSRWDWVGPVLPHEEFSDDQIDLDGGNSESDGSLESPGVLQDEFRGIIWDAEARGVGLGEEDDVGPDAVDRVDWAAKA
jgi:hypothetical protein